MGTPKGGKIGRGDTKFGVEQGAVNIDGDEAQGIGGHSQF
jgi:hypothetical protein